MIVKLLVLCVLVLASNAAEKARFDNYRIYQVQVENEEQMNLMKHIQENSDSVNCCVFEEFF
jgi:hypothetical protein